MGWPLLGRASTGISFYAADLWLLRPVRLPVRYPRGGGGAALAALVLSVLGTCMVLSVSGLYTYGIPLLAQEYVNGQQDALQMATAITGGKIYAVLFPSVFLYVVSFVLFGIAVWRSELLPKWAGALLALAGLLVLAPPPTVIALLGNILLIVAGGWIALGVLGRRSAGAA